MHAKQILMGAVVVTAIQMASAQTFTNADLFNVNLIVNGNAETVVNPADVTEADTRGVIPVPGWQKEGYFTIVKYLPANTTDQYVSQKSQGPDKRGISCFEGGANFEGVNSAKQKIDLAPARTIIDTGNVMYELSGYFGKAAWFGYGRQWSSRMSVQFLDQNGQVLDSTSVGDVTADELGGIVGLLQRQTSGKLPSKTRSVNVLLSLDAYSGIADNVSFTLFSPEVLPQSVTVNSAVEILMPTEQGKTYQLQYIPDLETQTGWINMGVPFQGDGTVYRIFDSCTPGKPRRFYRMMVVQ